MNSIVFRQLIAKAAEIITSPIRLVAEIFSHTLGSNRVEADGYRSNGDIDFNELATSVAQCSPAMALDLIRQMDQYQALLQRFADLPAESC